DRVQVALHDRRGALVLVLLDGLGEERVLIDDALERRLFGKDAAEGGLEAGEHRPERGAPTLGRHRGTLQPLGQRLERIRAAWRADEAPRDVASMPRHVRVERAEDAQAVARIRDRLRVAELQGWLWEHPKIDHVVSSSSSSPTPGVTSVSSSSSSSFSTGRGPASSSLMPSAAVTVSGIARMARRLCAREVSTISP